MGRLETSRFGKRGTHRIYECEKSYKIKSDQFTHPTMHATVNKESIDKVYNYLRKRRTELSAEDIEKALHISPTTIHNALKVLRLEGKASLRISGTNRQYLYKVLW